MKLYDATSAPNPRLVRMFLAEKGVEVPLEQVDIGAADNRKAPFLEINPMGTLPVLELDDGSHLAETIAICRYFEALQPEPPLMGHSPGDQGMVEMWRRRMELEVVLPMLHVFQHSNEFFKERITQCPEWAEVCRETAIKRLRWLDSELGKRPYIAGEEYTIADIQALAGIDFAKVAGFRAARDYANIGRWHEQVSARPSAKA
jgi:glutathione S-transferase